MGRATIIRDQRAFALPTVLITSIVMLTVLLAALTAASSISAGLKNQYANQLARTASQSGLTMAKTCMEASNGTITWTQAKPLKPNTDCTGTESVSCPITATSAACYVLKAGNYRTTYRVGVIYDSGNNPTDIDIKGIVREVRKTSGEVVREGTASIKANVQGATSTSGSSATNDTLVATNGGTCAIADGTLYCWGYSGYGQMGSSSSYVQTPTAVAGSLAGKTVAKVSSSPDTNSGNLYGHTCAIAEGNLYCWGYNGYYQVGNGNTTTQYSPVQIAGALAGKTVTDVLTFNMGTCAIADGTLYCWGYSGSGQLGNGSTGYVQTPTAVAGALAGKTVTKVSASADNNPNNGYGHTCAVADGNLYCWGYSAYYQVGTGNTTTQNSPVQITGALAGKTVTEITAFNLGTCAIADGTLYCWGYSGYGQLGNGSSSYSQTPTAVAGVMAGKTVTKVSSSFDTDPVNYYGHTCAIADGSLYCFGYNSYYQIGNGTTSVQYSPVLVSGSLAGKTVTGALALNGGTCAIADATLYCWGYSGYGQLGSSSSYVQTPTAVAGTLAGRAVTKMSSSPDSNPSNLYGHTCAIADSNLYCWGYNGYYQVGNGNTTTQYSPISVGGSALPGGAPLGITNGSSHTCAVGSDSNAYCWGYNGYGQLGNNSTTASSAAVAVSQGAIPAGVKIKSISAGDRQSCVVGNDNKAYCWGANNFYQLGNGSGTNSSIPVAVSQGAMPSTTIKSISVGAHHACVIGSNDKAYCWGANDQGYLGNGTNTNSSTPGLVSQGAVPSGVTYKSISAGQYHTCAIGSDDKAYCWGYNIYGQLGNGSTSDSTIPVAVSQGAVPSGVTYKSISAGQYHTCAIGSDDKAYCWGYGANGQVGNGATSNYNSSPVAVSQGALPTGSLVKQITAGGSHTCAIGSDDKAYCWGYGANGQLGNNLATSSSIPVAVSGGGTYTSITVEGNHTCSVAVGGYSYCWGYNGYGQLGNQSTTQSNVPVKVLQSPLWGLTSSPSSPGGTTASYLDLTY